MMTDNSALFIFKTNIFPRAFGILQSKIKSSEIKRGRSRAKREKERERVKSILMSEPSTFSKSYKYLLLLFLSLNFRCKIHSNTYSSSSSSSTQPQTFLSTLSFTFIQVDQNLRWHKTCPHIHSIELSIFIIRLIKWVNLVSVRITHHFNRKECVMTSIIRFIGLVFGEYFRFLEHEIDHRISILNRMRKKKMTEREREKIGVERVFSAFG